MCIARQQLTFPCKAKIEGHNGTYTGAIHGCNLHGNMRTNSPSTTLAKSFSSLCHPSDHHNYHYMAIIIVVVIIIIIIIPCHHILEKKRKDFK